MDIILPCLNRLKGTGGSVAPTSISFGASPGGIMTDVEFASAAVDLGILLIQPELFVVFPFMPFGWDWAFDILGLGPSEIEIQKEQIQAFMRPVFSMLNKGYGYPLFKGPFLKISWDYVKLLLGKRPDLAVLAPTMQDEADRIVTGAFGYDKSGPGIRQRMVNQYLANASLDRWTVQATVDAWKGIVAASTCPPPPKVYPPAPPPPPPPDPKRPCPPDYTQAQCIEICGQFRQLTAGQQVIPYDLMRIMSYFEDCFLPPDGTWTYKYPDPQFDASYVSTADYPFLADLTRLKRVPSEMWPYQFPSSTRVDQVVELGDGETIPQYTLFVNYPDGTQYMVLPDGSCNCRPDQQPLPEPPDPTPPPEPPPPEPPPPPPPPAWGVQLRADLDALTERVSQFQQTMLLQADSIKRALWQSMIRGNFQAAEVYAADQPGWQGGPPSADQPPYPASWDQLPTPGVPQVLEMPPIQSFPQVLEIPPVDLSTLQQQLNDLKAQEAQLNAQIAALTAQVPVEIGAAVQTYDQGTVQPALQQIREECCQPQAPPPPPPEPDICQEGRDKWGMMAECWLEANTEDIADPTAEVREAWDNDAILNQFPRIATDQLTPFEQGLVDVGEAAFLAAANGEYNLPPGIGPIAQRSWIYIEPPPVGTA